MHVNMSEASAFSAISKVTTSSLPGSVAVGVWYVALWLMLGRYWGLQHDAQLYVLQALNNLAPDLYGSDIYLRFAGNADLTVFPKIAAVFIDWLGINRGASLLTALSLAAWYLAAWLLLRGLMDRSQASLAIGLLLVVPIWYGSHQVFRLAEYFLSARPLTEALSLGTLAALVANRKGLACVLAGAAVAMHPLVAFPAVLVGVCFAAVPVERWKFAAGTLVLLIAAGLVGAAVMGGADRLMSGEWLELTTTRSRYLFMESWSPGDWQTSIVPIATVFLVALALRPSRLATLAMAGAVVACAGLLLTIVSSVLPLTLILQGQPWRWTWLAGLLAVASLCVLIPRLWSGTSQERAIALTLTAAWLLRDWSSSDQLPPIGAGGLLAVTALLLWPLRSRLSERIASLLVTGSLALCSLVVIGLMASILPVIDRDSHFGPDPLWIQLGIELLRVFPPIAAAVVILGWTLSQRAPARYAPVAVAAAALFVGSTASTGAAMSWIQDPLSTADRERFTDWRALIPIGSEILWPEFAQGPWFLLERPSYLSTSQLAGIVFSKALAMEARQRAAELSAAVDPDVWFGESGAQADQKDNLAADVLCQAAGLDYAVLERDNGKALATAEWPGPGRHVHLYACSAISAEPSHSPSREPSHTLAARQAT